MTLMDKYVIVCFLSIFLMSIEVSCLVFHVSDLALWECASLFAPFFALSIRHPSFRLAQQVFVCKIAGLTSIQEYPIVVGVLVTFGLVQAYFYHSKSSKREPLAYLTQRIPSRLTSHIPRSHQL